MPFTAKVPEGMVDQTGFSEEDILAQAAIELANIPVYNEGTRQVDFMTVGVAGNVSVDMPADYRFAGMSGAIAYFFRAGETAIERESRAIDMAVNTLFVTRMKAQQDTPRELMTEEEDDDNIIRNLFGEQPDAE